MARFLRLSCFVVSLLGVSSPGWAECTPAMDTFWTDFRAAVLAHDMPAIKRMTKFPVKVMPLLDDDGIDANSAPLAMDARTFERKWDRILAQDSGISEEKVTTFSVIEAKPQLSHRDCSAGSFVVPNLGFEETKGGYKLSYIDDNGELD